MNTDLHSALDEIEKFVIVGDTLASSDEAPRRLRAQLLAKYIGDSFAGHISNRAFVAMQHAYILKDLLTTFGGRERITDWTTLCLARIRELRQTLAVAETS